MVRLSFENWHFSPLEAEGVCMCVWGGPYAAPEAANQPARTSNAQQPSEVNGDESGGGGQEHLSVVTVATSLGFFRWSRCHACVDKSRQPSPEEESVILVDSFWWFNKWYLMRIIRNNLRTLKKTQQIPNRRVGVCQCEHCVSREEWVTRMILEVNSVIRE